MEVKHSLVCRHSPACFKEPITSLPSSYRRVCSAYWPRPQVRGSVELGEAQVLVDGFPADSEVTGKEGFRYTDAGALDQLGGAFRCKGLFPPLVGAALLSQGDALLLAFPDATRVRVR
jgi:hypothetical protein